MQPPHPPPLLLFTITAPDNVHIVGLEEAAGLEEVAVPEVVAASVASRAYGSRKKVPP